MSDLTAQYDVSDTTKLFVRAKNLLDTDYEQVYGYRTQGRALLEQNRLTEAAAALSRTPEEARIAAAIFSTWTAVALLTMSVSISGIAAIFSRA